MFWDNMTKTMLCILGIIVLGWGLFWAAGVPWQVHLCMGVTVSVVLVMWVMLAGRY